MDDLKAYELRLFWLVIPFWVVTLFASMFETPGWAWFLAGAILTYLSNVRFFIIAKDEPKENQKEV